MDTTAIISRLMFSKITEDNLALTQENRSLKNEADALRMRLQAMTAQHRHALNEVERLNSGQQDMMNDIALMDMIAKEYFINDAGARVRWHSRVHFLDDEYNESVVRNEAFGMEVDYSGDGVLTDEDLNDLEEVDQFFEDMLTDM